MICKQILLPSSNMIIFCISAGFLVYFLYGMRYSHENRPMSSYNRVITYSGDANLSESTMDRLDEEIHQQQPPPQGAFKGE